MPLDCIVRTSYYSRLIFKCTWPLVAYALVGLLARKLVNMGEKRANQADSLINFAFFLMFILYPSISSSLFSMFYCVELEDGTSWLRVDLTLECSTDAYRAMMAFTFVMLGLHTVGTPVCYAYLYFWKHHSALEALKEQELEDAAARRIEGGKAYVSQKAVVVVGEPKGLQPRIEAKDLLPGYMLKLTGGYEYRTYWFELFETIRKVLLVGVPSTFPERGGTLQLFWGLLVCFATFGAYMMYAPFIKDSDDVLSQLAAQIFLTLLSSLALRTTAIESWRSRNRDSVLVPLLGVALETKLLDELRSVLPTSRADHISSRAGPGLDGSDRASYGHSIPGRIFLPSGPIAAAQLLPL